MLEPFYGGSHKLWADGLAKYSQHNIHISSLPDRHWKWRMHGSALTFAERHKHDINDYDLVLVTDLCDVAALRGLLKIDVPVILYFHENQLAYPWSPTDKDVNLKRDRHYMWINFTSAIAADYCWFNSAYNRDSLISGIHRFLKAFPDHRKFDVENIEGKSKVVPLGLELPLLNHKELDHSRSDVPVILWNHRWEYDKGPELFFNTLYKLSEDDIHFELIVLGEKTKTYPTIFDQARVKLKDHIIHFGYAYGREKYNQLLLQATIYPVTSRQDFFGISVVEAISAGVTPLLPRGMVYEEYVDPNTDPNIFYNNEEELFQKLKRFCVLKPNLSFKESIGQFELREMIKIYDESFMNTLKSN